MPSLRELQQRFAADVLADAPSPAGLAYISGKAQRMSVYRNNIRHGFTDTLRAAFPVVERLVGETCFGQVAWAYIREMPSNSGNLQNYGALFPGFLAQRPELAALPYLGDVARLEWAMQEAYHAADAPRLDTGALARVPPECIPSIRFRLHPSVRLLESPYPVTRIWSVNQPDYRGDPTVSLDEGAAQVLIRRNHTGVGWQIVPTGTWSLLTAVSRHLDFETACARAQSAESEFSVDRALPALVADGVVVGFEIGADLKRPPQGAGEEDNESTRTL
jgi:hypothetical protein